jgi:hypothetical protein
MSKHPWNEFTGPAEPYRGAPLPPRSRWQELAYLIARWVGWIVGRIFYRPPPAPPRPPKPWTLGRILTWVAVGWLAVATWPIWLFVLLLILATVGGH